MAGLPLGASLLLCALLCAASKPEYCPERPEQRGLASLCALGARVRRAAVIDACGNSTLSSLAWMALAQGAAAAAAPRRPVHLVAYVPSRRAGGRQAAPGEVVEQREPLSRPVQPTELLLLALPPQQRAAALRLNAAQARRWLLVLQPELPGGMPPGVEEALGGNWLQVPGDWPAWLAVLRRQRHEERRWGHGAARSITFVSIVGDGVDFGHNLGASQVYRRREALPHRWVLPKGTGGLPLSRFLAQLRREAEGELLLFLHADVFLPDNFEAELFAALRRLEALDPRWAMAGFFGVPLDWQPGRAEWPWAAPRIVGRGRDFFGRYAMAASNVTAAQCLDETALLLRGGREPSPAFDEELPSTERIWLGGTDTLLEGLAQGRRSYILGVEVYHSIWDREGRSDRLLELQQRFLVKYASAQSTMVHAAAMSHMSRKFLWGGRLDRRHVWAQNCDFSAERWRSEPASIQGSIPFDLQELRQTLLQRQQAL